MERLFDLPAHPLLVHYPVVAIPVLCIAALVMIARPGWRRSWRIPIVLLAVSTAAATLLAASSGEALAELINAGDYLEDHRSLGETLRLFVVGLAVFTIALTVVGDQARTRPAPAPAIAVLSAIVAVLAVLSFIWVIRTGHEGAKIHWEVIVPPEDG